MARDNGSRGFYRHLRLTEDDMKLADNPSKPANSSSEDPPTDPVALASTIPLPSSSPASDTTTSPPLRGPHFRNLKLDRIDELMFDAAPDALNKNYPALQRGGGDRLMAQAARRGGLKSVSPPTKKEMLVMALTVGVTLFSFGLLLMDGVVAVGAFFMG